MVALHLFLLLRGTQSSLSSMEKGKGARQREHSPGPCAQLLLLLSLREERPLLGQTATAQLGLTTQSPVPPPPSAPRGLSCWLPAAAAQALRSNTKHKSASGGLPAQAAVGLGPVPLKCPALSHRALQTHCSSTNHACCPAELT